MNSMNLFATSSWVADIPFRGLAFRRVNSTLNLQYCLSVKFKAAQFVSEILIVKIQTLILFVAVTSVGMVFSGCQTPQLPKPQPPKVTVAKPLQKDVVDYSDFTGIARSTDSVEIRARVQGILQTADFTAGTIVEKDALLFTIEPEPFQARLDAAKAALSKTEAALKLAEANLGRAETLVASKAVSKEEYQTKIAQRDAAAAQILADKADIERASIDLSYTKILSPIRGKVGRKLVDPGNLVGGAEKTLLTTVVSLDPMYVYFDVSEPIILEYLKWKRETKLPDAQKKIYLGLADEEGYPHEGHLNFLDNRVDPATGTALIRGLFPNDKGYLYPGLYVRVRIPGQTQKDALLVREDAIGTDLGGKYVLVVDKDNIVEQRNVVLGTLVDGMRVVRKGLSADENYVIKGIQRARPGLPVDPIVEQAAPEPATDTKSEKPAEPESKADTG